MYLNILHCKWYSFCIEKTEEILYKVISTHLNQWLQTDVCIEEPKWKKIVN